MLVAFGYANEYVVLIQLFVDVHAFLGWFDTHFNACHKRISFSTGPHAKVSFPFLSCYRNI
jgi:hypothetical protein